MANYVVIEWDDCREDFEIILATDDLEQAKTALYESENDRQLRAVGFKPFFQATSKGITPSDTISSYNDALWDYESALAEWAQSWVIEDDHTRRKIASKQAAADGYLYDHQLTYEDPNWKPSPAPTSCITWFGGVAPRLEYDKDTLRAFFPNSPEQAFQIGAWEKRVSDILRGMKKPYGEVPAEIKKHVAQLLSVKP